MGSGGPTTIYVGQNRNSAFQADATDDARTLASIEIVVCPALGVTSSDLRARTRSRASVAFARQVSMYLAHVVYGMSLKDAASLFHRDRTTAAHACSVIEDKRDDPAFDAFMEHIELAILHLRRIPLGVDLHR